MPKEIEIALRKRAKKLGLKGSRADRYIYGTMKKRGNMGMKKDMKPKMSLKEMMMQM